MSAFTKFYDFVEQLGAGVHNFSSHSIKVYLSNEVPLVTDTVKADIAEITAGNGYTAGGASITPVWSETAGVAILTGTDVTWTATGGPIGPFRYVILYNDSATNDNLIGWWDYGSELTINADEAFEAFKTDFGSSILTIS